MPSLLDRTATLLILLLVANGCGDGDGGSGGSGGNGGDATTEPESVLPDRAIAFAIAGDDRDLDACSALCTKSARAFFEAEAEFSALLLVEEGELRPKPERSAETVGVEGDSAVVRIDTVRGEEEQVRSAYFVFLLEDGKWRVDGFVESEGGETRRFADLVARTRERIERAKAERTPHAELGPIVEAYLAAAGAKDGDAMFAMMTPECSKREATGDNAFTAGFLAGRFKVHKWQFGKHETNGDQGWQSIKTIFELADGETGGQSLRFQFDREDGAWKISTIE